MGRREGRQGQSLERSRAVLIANGLRKGRVCVPPSKSHIHRLLIADALAGDRSRLEISPDDCEDVKATKRCLRELFSGKAEVTLDVGESGSTLRFLSPLVPALGKKARFVKSGRLAARPAIEYSRISPGLHELPGNVSSQFVTGLLFALPLLPADSEIRFSGSLESRGYVDMTLRTVRDYGISVEETSGGFLVPGNQRFALPDDDSKRSPECDWSGAAFWICANAMGNDIEIPDMNFDSLQPDRAVVDAAERLGGEIDISLFPDSFPVLAVAASCRKGTTLFTGTRRLRLKESDRVAAMSEVLSGFGVEAEESENTFAVRGKGSDLDPGTFRTFGDHRIAMSIAIGATRASDPVEIDDSACASKSYPRFFENFASLTFLERL